MPKFNSTLHCDYFREQSQRRPFLPKYFRTSSISQGPPSILWYSNHSLWSAYWYHHTYQNVSSIFNQSNSATLFICQRLVLFLTQFKLYFISFMNSCSFYRIAIPLCIVLYGLFNEYNTLKPKEKCLKKVLFCIGINIVEKQKKNWTSQISDIIK